MIYLRYLWYVLRHKWFVFVGCMKVAPVSLFWRSLVHDLSKLRPSEFLPYAEHFYGRKARQWRRDETGYYKPTNTGDKAFDRAWFWHQARNDHHWQYWVFPDDGGKSSIVLPMSRKARLEMICDWRGAGRAPGHAGDTVAWYTKHRGKLVLERGTRDWIEVELGLR
jgi:hypothetical protein